MSSIAADSLYDVSYRSSWGGDGDGALGHLVIRRLDDHEIVAEIPARTEDEAQALIADAETDVRCPAHVFESTYLIGPDLAADPGPDVIRRPAQDASDRDTEREPGERITAADPRLTVFPDPLDVFVADHQQLSELLHPLVSIDLSAVDPSWYGRAHLISPVDEMSDASGDSDADAANWILFRVEDDGRFRLLGRPDLLDDARTTAGRSSARAGYPWRSDGADAILLFFEPETRTAALTFDWG